MELTYSIYMYLIYEYKTLYLLNINLHIMRHTISILLYIIIKLQRTLYILAMTAKRSPLVKLANVLCL